MRIALLTVSFWPVRGGMEFVVHDLATALHDLGHDVHVFAPRNKLKYPEIDHRYHLVRFGWPVRGAYRFGLNRFLLHRAFPPVHGAEPFDVINAHSAYLPASYALSLSERFGIPVVVTGHGQDIQSVPELGYGFRLDPARDQVIRHNLRQADRVVAISESIFTELAEVVSESKIERIPNGVDLAELAQPREGFLKQRLGVHTGKVILSVGRNHPVKSFDTGLRAFTRVAQQVPEVLCVHIGKGSEPLQDLAQDLGVGDRFYTLGEVGREQVFAAYQEADVFFSPSTAESFGLVNIEAMAAGLPCVVTDGRGNQEAVVHGRNGWIVPVGDEEQMADALLDLLEDEPKRCTFGQASREIVATKYDWPIVARAYEEVFQGITHHGPPSGVSGSRIS